VLDGGETAHYRELAVPLAQRRPFFILTFVPQMAAPAQARPVGDPVAGVCISGRSRHSRRADASTDNHLSKVVDISGEQSLPPAGRHRNTK
jgi:hypothetical protein